ncbi:hypothetical protein [Persicobacter diffluens]|uniref:Uncharacterized protein n=1 Tax=Persicobacter diffluens TaxID=981 RepID=A0AAN5ANL0_9BACT|nr:hypothetical protein PEDI_35200 [Persicobacter diffluens]
MKYIKSLSLVIIFCNLPFLSIKAQQKYTKLQKLEINNPDFKQIINDIYNYSIEHSISDTLYYVKILPIQSLFFVGGVNITKIDSLNASQIIRKKAKGYFSYKDKFFLVSVYEGGELYDDHWLFIMTGEENNILLPKPSDQFEIDDNPVNNHLTWWYRYYITDNRFELSFSIDHQGNAYYHIDSISVPTSLH